MTEAGPSAIPPAPPPSGEAFNAGELILHHILDSREIEIPFTGTTIHLPHWEIAGYDLSLTRNVVMMWIASGVLILLFALAARRSKEPVPRGTRNVLEMLVLFVRDEIARKTIGPKADRYLGYLLTIFFFILTCNLLGLVPAMSTATSNISVTAGLAITAFGVIHAAGIREHGLVGHLKNFVPTGLPSWLLPIMLPLELLTVFTRPFVLCMRLFANMTAGHVVIITLISIIFILQKVWIAGMSVPFTLFIYMLEILVAFLQAFIFTMLTSLFVGMAIHPAH